MPASFPNSPHVMKGGIVAYQFPELVPTLVVFQYNPDQVTRSVQPRGAPAGGGQGDAQRLNGVPEETVSMQIVLDATDQLEEPRSNALTVANGLHPAIAALEQLAYPAYPTVVANEVLALAGSAFILGEQAPMAFLIWGPRRVLPIQVQSLSITEEAFDQALNPIRARVDAQFRVMTYRDFTVTHPGYWVYMAAFTQKEVMATLNTFEDAADIRSILPI